MIELLDPRKIGKGYRELWEKRGWSYRMDYNWIMQNVLRYKPGDILDVGPGSSKFGKFAASQVGARYTGIDRSKKMDFADYEPRTNHDCIMWVSSLEHNHADVMRKLYLRSIEMLPAGGLLLVTVPAAPETYWYEPSEHLNMTCDFLCYMFDEEEVIGEYWDVQKAYHDDPDIKKRYIKRYGHWGDDDPVMISAGVKKVK